MPLSMCSAGDEVEVGDVLCGQNVKKRLHDLGIYDRTRIEVIRNDVSGPLLVRVKDTKLALGRGQADKILVKERTGQKPDDRTGREDG
ncbi:MAG: ferrous iron transport protein A [DPANN group archaeon]|nr:ferrous iron transport protein A [DPANN group archaeon]